MKRYTSLATLLLITACLVVWSCGGTPQVPLEQQQYIEGTIVEGGALGFILKSDAGGQMRFAAYHDAVYNPPEFHALAGDRLGVTYGVTGQTKTKNIALEIVLLKPDGQRREMTSPAVGVVREAGMTRHKIHLPDYNFTVIMLKGKAATSLPDDWKPETGDKIRVQFSETAGRFMRKTFYDALELVEKGPVAIDDLRANGSVVNQDRGVFTVRLSDNRTHKFYTEKQTSVHPEDAEVISGDAVQITYYRKLMGDRTFRSTATAIHKIK